jgi:Zn-dependent peptidase ImmA (M78 family)
MSGLIFQIRWISTDANDAMEASFGEIGAWIGSDCVWGRGSPGSDWGGIEWPLIEVLEHLAKVWQFLVAQDRDPFGIIDPSNTPPSMLRSEMERRWKLAPSTDEDERSLATFELAHDLSKAFNGAWPPFLWLVRCGSKFIVESDRSLSWFEDEEIFGELERLGNGISERIAPYSDVRGNSARARWERRKDVSPRRSLQLVTGLDASELEEIAGKLSIEEFWEMSGTQSYDYGEIAAAARMAAKCLSLPSLSRVLNSLRASAKRSTPKLDAYCAAYTEQYAKHPFERPFEEGHFAAEWLRQQEQFENSPLVDARLLLLAWNVEISEVQLPEKEIDAVAAWGRLHGPVVLLNSNGHHVKHIGARNVTLAHEICHLIIDRREALPVAEVLGGKVMESIEARARAFAAELLLPRRTAYDVFREQLNRGYPIDSVISLISRSYMVSKEVVAWQIRNRQEPLSTKEHQKLRQYVNHRQVF